MYLCVMNWKKYVIPYDFNKLLARLTQQKAVLDSHRPIPDFRIARIREALALEWTYNSNSIEGNTLTLLETQVVIEDGLTVSGKSLREHFEAVNHHEAIAFVRELAQPGYILNKRDILDIHAIVLDKIDKRIAGRVRDEEQLQELIAWYHNEGQKLHAVIRTSIFHHRLVWIHPFFDGNGRTARLVFNLLLMSEGYPPAIILTVDRKKYYTALRNGDQGDYEKLLFLIGQSLERSLAIYISNIEGTSNEFKPIPDIIKEPDISYGQEYVSLLARQGKIEAYKEGRVWYTRKKAITNYQATRERKRK